MPPDLTTRIAAPSDEVIAEAARLLRSGELVAFPTETVYGLGGDATNGEAVAKIFAAKERPQFNPLIVHVPDVEACKELAEWHDTAEQLAAKFWPGPLTLVLPRRQESPVSLLASAGLDTIAVRVPRHPLAQTLLQAVGLPIAAPSANRSGMVSPTTAQHVLDSLGGRVRLILDGGPCEVGLESTVIDLSTDSPTLLRPGGVSLENLREILGKIEIAGPETPLKSPGMTERHYAPGIPLRINVTNPSPDETVVAFGPHAPSGSRNLSPSGDLAEAAANLFAVLRKLDRPENKAIAVMPIPERGLGVAINDRLRRAAFRPK